MLTIAQRRFTFSETLLRLVLGLSLIGMAGMATAGPANITETEMKLLPRYCPDTQTFGYGNASYNPSPRAGYWVSLMGNTFWAMHHYCWAQINMNRSRKAGVPAQERRAMWESARGDYGYVVANAPPDFILLPEIYTRIGEVEILLNNADKANEAFARARQLKPDYWPAYSHWAIFLMKIGRRAEALKIVASGLQYSPEAKVLVGLFRDLGGKTSDIPKSVEKPKETNDSVTQTDPSVPGKPHEPDTKSDEK